MQGSGDGRLVDGGLSSVLNGTGSTTVLFR